MEPLKRHPTPVKTSPGDEEQRGAQEQETHRLSPEEMRERAHILSASGRSYEAAHLLRRALEKAESELAGPERLLPLTESLAEVLWKLSDRREARRYANRAIQLWFQSRRQPPADGET